MRPVDQHLGADEIELLAGEEGVPPGLEQQFQHARDHAASCEVCSQRIQVYRTKGTDLNQLRSSKRAGKGPECPTIDILLQVAGGILPVAEQTRYLAHTSQCDHCGPILREIVKDFSDLPSEEEAASLSSLESSTEEWQQRLRNRIAESKPQGKNRKDSSQILRPEGGRSSRPFWRRLFFYATPAAACVVAVLMVSNSLYAKRQLREVQEFVDSEYGKGRPAYYRLAGMPYQRNRSERGPGDIRPSIEMPKSVRSKAPRLAAETAFLEDDPGTARDILEQARRAGDTSVMTLNDLVVAIAMKARSQADYEKALALSDEVLKLRPDDATVYFNRALIFGRLDRHEDARKALEQFRRLEHDPGWLADAEKILPSS